MRDPHQDWRHRLSTGPVHAPPFFMPGDLDDEPLEDVPVLALIAGFLGISLHAALAYFPYIFTLFVAPLPVILGVYGSWALMFKLIVRWREPHPYLVLATPVIEMIVWFVVMQVGWTYLGWPPLYFPENG